MSEGARRVAVRAGAGALVLAACAMAARGLDWGAVLRAMRGASAPLLAAAAALNLLHVWLCGVAWSVMLSPVGRVPVRRSFRYNLLAFAASSFLPSVSGDLLRMGMLRTGEGLPLASVAAVSLVDKAVGVMTLLLLAAPLPLLVPSLPRWTGLGFATLGGGALLALALAWRAPSLASRLPARLARFAEGARVMRDPRVFFGALTLTALQWAVDAASMHLALRALDLRVHPAAPFFVLLSQHVAVALPMTPAQAGSFEAGVVVPLMALGVGREPSVAFALVLHALTLASYGAFGLAALAWPVAPRRPAS